MVLQTKGKTLKLEIRQFHGFNSFGLNKVNNINCESLLVPHPGNKWICVGFLVIMIGIFRPDGSNMC